MTEERPRLLIVADALSGGLGGVVQDHSSWFAGRGWDVLVASKSDPRNAELEVPAVEVPVPDSVRHVARLLRAGRALREAARRFRPDVVHCHGMRAFAVALAGRTRGIVHLHGSGDLPSDPPLYGYVRRAGLRVLPRIAVGAFSASPDTPGGWRFAPETSPRLRDLRPLPLPTTGVPTFLWLGRLSEQKRPDVFLRALTLVGRDREVRGVVAGTGPLEAETKALARQIDAPVEFLGETPDVPRLLGESWAVVLLSRFEGMPLAVEEAMWAGRAVVASSIPPLEWLVGPAGFLVSSVDDAAAALRTLCDAGEARRFGELAAQRVRSLITPDGSWPQIAELYASLDASRRGR